MFKNAGSNLLIYVSGFGVSMIVFDLSKNFHLTLFILTFDGGFNNVSVIIRTTIIRIYTPDEIYGRVS